MLNENAQKWVAALRSGKYKQCRYVLQTNDSYCCLGVACRLYQEEVGDLQEIDLQEIDDSHGSIHCKTFDSHSVNLPERVRNWLGLRNSMGHYRSIDRDVEYSLVGLNDWGKSFNEIADLIEKEPEELFVSQSGKDSSDEWEC